MSNGKEYESKGNINFFGVTFGSEDFESLYENGLRVIRRTRIVNTDFISSLPFAFTSLENGIVVYSAALGSRLAIAKPDLSTTDEYTVVELNEDDFNEIF